MSAWHCSAFAWHCSACSATTSASAHGITLTRVTCPYCHGDMTKLERVRIIPLEPKVMHRKSFFEWLLDGFRTIRL